MLTRCFFVKGSALVMAAAGQVPGVSVDASRFAGKDAAAIAHDLLHRDAGPETLGAIAKGMEGKQPKPETIMGLVISSPEFQRR